MPRVALEPNTTPSKTCASKAYAYANSLLADSSQETSSQMLMIDLVPTTNVNMPKRMRLGVNRWSRRSAQRILLSSTTAFCAILMNSPIIAELGELKVQGPWAYGYRIDRENNIEFMATTSATEDDKVWLVLACKDNQRIGISMSDSAGFEFPLTENGQLNCAARWI
jgi:hypothetical protein